MVEQIEKCIINNIMISENTSNVKEEFNDDDFVEDKVIVCETAISADHTDLKDNAKIKQHEILTALDIKMELPSPEVQNNTIDGNVMTEETISVCDIKIEFDNGLLFCEDCRVYCQDYCTECGMLLYILNKNGLDTDNGENLEIPSDILEIRELFGRFRTFALKVIPRDVKLGAFTGLDTWKIKAGKFMVSEERTKTLNWMQHVNPARNISERNLRPFQFEGDLYYRSTREIQAGEELLVHFGEEYDQSLDGDLEMDFIPATERNVGDVFACTFCCLGFSSKMYLMRHRAICRTVPDGHISTAEFTQCPSCNIYFDEEEYNKYHMPYCRERNARKSTPPIQHNQTVEVKCGGSVNVEAEQTRQDLRGECKRRAKTKYEICKSVERLKGFRHNCAECDYKTNNKENLSRHMKTNHIKEYKCEMCNSYKTNSKPIFDDHMKRKHLKEWKYKCKMCDYKAKKYSYLQKHVRTRHQLKGCEICEYKTDSNVHLEIHVITKHPKEFEYKCGMCEFRTKVKSHLKIHAKTKHPKELNYKCEICDYKTDRESCLKMHVKTKHLKEFEYKCEACEYETNLQSDLKRHTKRKHLNESSRECEVCDFKANHKSQLESHMKVHLHEFNYKCEMCEYRTNHQETLHVHVNSEHPKEFSYRCETCDYKTDLQLHMTRHAKKHAEAFDYACDTCDFKTNWKAHLKRHTIMKHLKEFSHECETCDFKTYQKSYLESHVKAKHLKEFDYKCEMCDYKTQYRRSLKVHVKTKHLKEFSHQCETCPFKTNLKLQMKRHAKKHLETFDYACETCDYKTNWKACFKNHTKTKHLKEFDYACDLCEYKTNQKPKLKVHRKAAHLKEFNYKCAITERGGVQV